MPISKHRLLISVLWRMLGKVLGRRKIMFEPNFSFLQDNYSEANKACDIDGKGAHYPLDELIPVSVNIPIDCPAVKNPTGFADQFSRTRLEIMESYVSCRMTFVQFGVSDRGAQNYFCVDSEGREWWIDSNLIPFEAFVEHRTLLGLVRSLNYGMCMPVPESLVNRKFAVSILADSTDGCGINRFLLNTETCWDKINKLWKFEEKGIIGPVGSISGFEYFAAADLSQDDARTILQDLADTVPPPPNLKSITEIRFTALEGNCLTHFAIEQAFFQKSYMSEIEITWLSETIEHAEFTGFDLQTLCDVYRIPISTMSGAIISQYFLDNGMVQARVKSQKFPKDAQGRKIAIPLQIANHYASITKSVFVFVPRFKDLY